MVGTKILLNRVKIATEALKEPNLKKKRSLVGSIFKPLTDRYYTKELDIVLTVLLSYMTLEQKDFIAYEDKQGAVIQLSEGISTYDVEIELIEPSTYREQLMLVVELTRLQSLLNKPNRGGY